MLRTITVAQLRAALDGEDDDALVVVTADYGDIMHTPQALPLRGRLEECIVARAQGYSQSGYRLVDEDDEDTETTAADEGPRYLVLR